MGLFRWATDCSRRLQSSFAVQLKFFDFCSEPNRPHVKSHQLSNNNDQKPVKLTNSNLPTVCLHFAENLSWNWKHLYEAWLDWMQDSVCFRIFSGKIHLLQPSVIGPSYGSAGDGVAFQKNPEYKDQPKPVKSKSRYKQFNKITTVFDETAFKKRPIS